jgi:hypothetical protein
VIAQGARIVVHDSEPSHKAKGIQRTHHDAGSASIAKVTIDQKVRASTGRHEAEEGVVVHGLCPCSEVCTGVDACSMRNEDENRLHGPTPLFPLEKQKRAPPVNDHGKHNFQSTTSWEDISDLVHEHPVNPPATIWFSSPIFSSNGNQGVPSHRFIPNRPVLHAW